MLKRISLLVIFLNLFPHCIWAQQRLQFAGLGEVGLIAGVSEPSVDARLSFGIKKKQFVITAGAGIDGYRYTTAPLFVHARYHFLQKRVQPLVYASVGANVIAEKALKNISADSTSWIFWNQRNLRYSGGFYNDAGVGVSLTFKKKVVHRLYSTLGWSTKKVVEKFDTPNYMTSGTDPVVNHFTMRRLIFRFGFEF